MEQASAFAYFPKEVLYGRRPGVALCTLWSPKTRYESLLPEVQAIGNLYSARGIGLMMLNILADPSIGCLVITGTDCPEPSRRQGDALYCGDVDPAKLRIPAEAVEAFYKRVRLIDAREVSPRTPEKLIDVLRDNLPTKTFTPLHFDLLAADETKVFPASRTGYLTRAATIRDAFYDLLREIRSFGMLTNQDSEGHYRQEIWQLSVVFASSMDWRKGVPRFSQEEVDRYGANIWLGTEPADLTYRYGHTMRHRYGDQVQAVIEAIRKKPETYRTMISLWDPANSIRLDDEPCLVTVHPRVRGQTLDLWAYIRTNDMWNAWPLNVAGLRIFQERLAAELRVSLGELSVTSGSAHIYDYAIPEVDEYLKAERHPSFQWDPKGDWWFAHDGQRFIGEHYQSGQLLQTVTAESVDALEKRILPFISNVSHAVYVGRLIERLAQDNQ